MTDKAANNSLFKKYRTPRGTIPFDQIRFEHLEPAIMEGIKREDKEIEAIVNNPATPNFANTFEAYSQSGDLLEKALTVLEVFLDAESSDKVQKLAQKISPLLTEHSNNILLNPKLFERIKYVYKNRKNENLNTEQKIILKETYKGFAENGANLGKRGKEKLRKLTEQLSLLSLQYSDNILKETNDFSLVITDKAQLGGLPESAVEAAKETAKEKGVKGWVFTLKGPSYRSFMTYSNQRDLRKQLYMARNTLGVKSNTDIVKQIVNLRLEMAKLLHNHTCAEGILKDRMAKNAKNVYSLLHQLEEAYRPTADQEKAEVEAMVRKEVGGDFQLMPWDWAYYSQKLREQLFHYNSEMLRPYLELDRVIKGVFGLAGRLYGIHFRRNKKISTYHPDVKVYEVYDKDYTYLGVLYTDFHPRKGKQSGAWMSELKGQWIDKRTGKDSRPHVSLVMNFSKPTARKPALLTLGEVTTFLHEFGHSLHGLFSKVHYESLCGTNVPRDFVELPSQFMENYATEEEFLSTFARHYKTGESIPSDYIKAIKAARNFHCGESCLAQISFALLDMAWHDRTEPFEGDVEAYERQVMERLDIFPKIKGTCMSTNFSHIFAGGYAAGYYGYKWAEVLDADAFSLFKEKGLFDRDTADSFRKHILSRGGTDDPMKLYKKFRGRKPTIDALLTRNGITKK